MAYRIPSGRHRIETEVAHSRFITTVGHATQVEEAKAFIGAIRAEMPDASHHVYAYCVGYGKSVIEGMSDDGEPAGTSGPPTLAVLRGYDIGDVVLVTTRYFGGTKLGTGGLVRAYTEAAHIALNSLPTELKIEKCLMGIEMPYSLYKSIRRLIEAHQGIVEDETFAVDVTLIVTLPLQELPALRVALSDASAGRITPVILQSDTPLL